MTNGLQNRQNGNSDDGINPLKRRSTDAGIDYPRRRATIAVRKSVLVELIQLLTLFDSARSVGLVSHDAMGRNQNVSSVQSWVQNVSIESLASNSMLGTSSSWNISPASRVYFSRISLAKHPV